MNDPTHIVRYLRGQMHGRSGLCFCPAHANARTPALSVALGDGGRLLLHCFAGCPFEAILDALRGLGLVAGWGHFSPLNTDKLAYINNAKKAAAQRKESLARKIWAEALPVRGTSAEAYLRFRGITAHLPQSLRFHPAAWHGPTKRQRPAMIAKVEGGEGFSIHRTFLKPEGSGKADVPNGTAKLMLGAARGGHIEVAHAEGPLVVAEGIETALSLASGLLGFPSTIWAALSTSGMISLRLPKLPGRLTIGADGDKAGDAAAESLAARATAHGWVVDLLAAPQARDWNDVLMMSVAT